jgi:hypothetical protein
VERNLECRGSFLSFETVTENFTAWDRPIAWCEHVSFGPPFLAPHQTGFYADLGKGYRTSGDCQDAFRWPEGRGTIPCDLTGFSAQPHLDLVNSYLVETAGEWASFAAWNSHLGALLGYAFRVVEFPWFNVWENHDDRLKTRGMELSNTPIEGTTRALMATPQVFGVPTFEWLSARSQIRKTFFSFSIDVPHDYRGVGSIEFDGKNLTVTELGTREKINLRN